MEEQTVSNQVQQANVQPQVPTELKHRSFLTNRLFLITLAVVVLFTIVYAGIYLYLGSQLDQISKSNQTAVTTQSSPIPTIDKTVSGKIYTIGHISFTLPEGWKINQGVYSTQDDEYFSLHSPDIEYPFPYGSGIGAVIDIGRKKTELTDTRCDPNEKISGEMERAITSDIKCIKINGKDVKSKHVDYEGHYLNYKFIHKGSIYTFSLQTSGVLKTEKKYLPFLESILDSINFEQN